MKQFVARLIFVLAGAVGAASLAIPIGYRLFLVMAYEAGVSRRKVARRRWRSR